MKTPVSQMPGTTPLMVDYLENFRNVAEFYDGDFRDTEIYLSRSDEIKARDLPLGKLAPILKEQNQRYGCGFQTLEKIDLLLERRACAVVTGQQTGLFSGPLYSIYKALTTIKLTERLSRTCEGCYVPVFWMASDDHDFREVNHVNVLDKSNQISEIVYQGHSIDARMPVSSIEMNSQISEALQNLHDATHPSEFKDEVYRSLTETYQANTVFSEAFGKWLMQLLKSFGVVIIDASDPRIKSLGADVFIKEIAEESPSSQQALHASEKLVKHNYHTQVQLHPKLLNLFYAEKERQSLEIQDGVIHVKGTENKFQVAELLKLIEERPHFFSPNVLLRPIYQDALLPTIAYIAGPAEIAYYAQMKGIYKSFNMPMPIIYPRKSLTLLEPKIEKVLESYHLNTQDFWGDVEVLINNIAKARLPENIEGRIENVSSEISNIMQTLEDVVTGFDPTLTNTVENVKSKIHHQMDVLEKKILQAYKKRNDVINQQIYKAKNSLYPNNHFQERVLNIVPYLFKYGFGFIDQLYKAIDISNFDHQIIRL